MPTRLSPGSIAPGRIAIQACAVCCSIRSSRSIVAIHVSATSVAGSACRRPEHRERPLRSLMEIDEFEERRMTITKTFRSLHAGPGLLVLPNAWDAGSARLIESIGAKAIATTSAGVAWARGYPDGDALPTELLLACAREITRIVRVPVTMDIEGGYSDDPATV